MVTAVDCSERIGKFRQGSMNMNKMTSQKFNRTKEIQGFEQNKNAR